MTTVHVARVERRIPHGPVPDRFPTHVMVLADDAGSRDLPIWLLGQDSHRFADDRHGPSPDELTGRAPTCGGDTRDRGERRRAWPGGDRGPDRTGHPGRPEHVTARLLDGLAMAITEGAPIRVADAVMDRLAVPTGTSQDGPMPERTAGDLSGDLRPRYEPRNLTFAAGCGPLGARRQLHRAHPAVPLAGLLHRR